MLPRLMPLIKVWIKGDLAEDAVQTIGTEEVNAIGELTAGLGEEGRGFLRIEGDEYQLDAGGDQRIDLRGEIGAGGGGEGLGLGDVDAQLAALRYESIIQTDGIIVIALIEDANGIDHVVILDVLGSGSALIGIVEADAESLIVAIDEHYRRSRRG